MGEVGEASRDRFQPGEPKLLVPPQNLPDLSLCFHEFP